MVSMSLYKRSSFKIGSYPAVAIDEIDKLLCGRKGWIWQSGPSTYRACYLSRGEERVSPQFGPDELGRWVSRIDLLSCTIEDQVRFANYPDDRHSKIDAAKTRVPNSSKSLSANYGISPDLHPCTSDSKVAS